MRREPMTIPELRRYMDRRFATKADVRKCATKADLRRCATKADLRRCATKADLRQCATKADLRRCATKADLRRCATKADLRRCATKGDLRAFARRADLAALRTEIRHDMQVLVESLELRMDRMFDLLSPLAGKSTHYDRVLDDHEHRIATLERRS